MDSYFKEYLRIYVRSNAGIDRRRFTFIAILLLNRTLASSKERSLPTTGFGLPPPQRPAPPSNPSLD
jgi:hypothetical protein